MKINKRIITILTILSLSFVAGCSGNPETSDILTTELTETTSSFVSSATEPATKIVTEFRVTTTTETTTEVTTTEVTNNDSLLNAYIDYSDKVGYASFEIMENLLQAYSDSNGLQLEITEPTDYVMGALKLKKTDENYVYFSFYPLNDVETLCSVQYDLNSTIQIWVSNETHISDVKYKIRDASKSEPVSEVSSLEEQIKFLNQYK